MATEPKGPKEGLVMAARGGNALVSVAQQREIAEVQAAMIVARMNPRDYEDCKARIKNACMRPELALKATYAYGRGGTDVRGASIRLAEVMAQNWGNIDFGVRELEQREDESTVEAYCWDMETNARQRRVFQVPHIRYSKEKGNVLLNDPRDVYELTANNGARRMRACILGIIPREVQDEALKQCELTLVNHIKVTPELIKALLDKFSEFGVTKAQLEARIQRRIEAILPAQVFALGEIYNSLKDSMSVPDEWFKAGAKAPGGPEKGALNVDELKGSSADNRGHGQENLDQVGQQPNAATSQQPAQPPKQEKPKSDTKRSKAETPAAPQASGNPSYSDTEGDPFKPGGDLFNKRDPGQEG